MSELCLPASVLDGLQIRNSNRRKSIGIKVSPSGVRVSKPRYVSQAEVMTLLQTRRTWLLEKLAQQQQRQQEKPIHHYGSGDCFQFLGRLLTLQVDEASLNGVREDQGLLKVTLSRRSQRPADVRVRELIGEWFSNQVLNYLTEQSRIAAARIGRTVTSVKVKITRSKWGHCSHQGELQYNWYIGFAPLPIIDYLVAHEVSHLAHMNHSATFWAQVQQLCPDYVAARHWLKRHGHSLVL